MTGYIFQKRKWDLRSEEDFSRSDNSQKNQTLSDFSAHV